jgi:hypothetical protein
MRLLTIAAAGLALATPVQAQLAPLNELGVTFAHVHVNVTDRNGRLIQRTGLVRPHQPCASSRTKRSCNDGPQAM